MGRGRMKKTIENPDPGEAGRPAAGGLREMLAIALPMVGFPGLRDGADFYRSPVPVSARIGTDERRHGRGLTSFMLMTFFIGLTGYATALVAQYLGAGGRVTASWSSPGRSSSRFWRPPDPGGPAARSRLVRGHGHPGAAARPAEALFRHSLSGDPGSAAELPQQLFSGIGQTRVVMFSA